jgi:hypothetical protein
MRAVLASGSEAIQTIDNERIMKLIIVNIEANLPNAPGRNRK